MTFGGLKIGDRKIGDSSKIGDSIPFFYRKIGDSIPFFWKIGDRKNGDSIPFFCACYARQCPKSREQ